MRPTTFLEFLATFFLMMIIGPFLSFILAFMLGFLDKVIEADHTVIFRDVQNNTSNNRTSSGSVTQADDQWRYRRRETGETVSWH